MMFTPHQADAVRRALRKGLGQEDPATGLDGRLGAALADTGRARFTADQKDDVKATLRTVDEEKELAVAEPRRASPRSARRWARPTPTGDVDGPAVAARAA